VPHRLAPILALALCACNSPAHLLKPLPGEQVADGVAVLRGEFVRGAQPDGNTVLLRGAGGLVVVDTGRHAVHTRKILDAAAPDRPLLAVVNTHWHLDHIAGNAALRAAFPQLEVHASDRVRGAMTGFLADYRGQLEQLLATSPDAPDADNWRDELARIAAGETLFPTHPVLAASDVELAGRALHLGLEDAVSGGDVWLLDRATGVLVAGDLVTLPAPLLDTACPRAWQAALARLRAVEFTVLVPGHGPPLTPAQFADYHAAFAHLLGCAAGDAAPDVCTDGWLHDLRDMIPPADVPLARDLLGYYVPDILRAPPGRRDCG
jgi:glyoxylase-like metal-dependent hydrolase (beta-lactamase superfamily II)